MRLTAYLLMRVGRFPPDDPWAKNWWQKINRHFRYGMSKPKTQGSILANWPGKNRQKVLVEPVKEWKFFRGDRVHILAGQDAGREGIISDIIRERNWVVVDSLNCHYRFIGKTEGYRGMYVKSEAPLLHREVALVDPSDEKPTDIEWKYTEEGEKVRVSVRTGRIIPFSDLAFAHPEYKSRDDYVEQPKDTVEKHVSKRTYKPSLKFVEEELMDALGIVETRKPAKTWWY